MGTRNYIGIVSTVNCSATVVKLITNKINNYLYQQSFNNIDGAVCLKHSSGCGMSTNGYGMEVFHRTIEGFKNHLIFRMYLLLALDANVLKFHYFKNQKSSNVSLFKYSR